MVSVCRTTGYLARLQIFFSQRRLRQVGRHLLGSDCVRLEFQELQRGRFLTRDRGFGMERLAKVILVDTCVETQVLELSSAATRLSGVSVWDSGHLLVMLLRV